MVAMIADRVASGNKTQHTKTRIKENNTPRSKLSFMSRKFTIYSTNGAINKCVVRKHLCEAIIQ
jgi:hypothetical protein